MKLRVRLVGALAVCGLGLVASPGRARADGGPPFQDPARDGSITLCNSAGAPITSGRVADAPFAWSVHTDAPAPAGYGIAGATATLLAYQPRQGVLPGDWSGMLMTPATRYTDPAHPTVQFTGADSGLDQVTSSYPPLWNGLLQLRVYLGAPGRPLYRQRYAALALQISADGQSWTAVDPGNVACAVGSGVSATTLLGLPTTRPVGPGPAHTGEGSAPSPAGGVVPAGGRSGPPAAFAQITSSPANGPHGSPAADQQQPLTSSSVASTPLADSSGGTVGPIGLPSTGKRSSSSSSADLLIGAVAIILAAAAGAAYVRFRRRPPGPVPAPASPDER